MAKFEWKKGKRKTFPARDGYGNDINFRLECQLDKGNKRFVLRWQDSTDRDPETGKKKSKTKSFKEYERAYQYVKDFEFREDLRNDKAKKRLTFLSEDQLRDAENALRRLPNNITLDQLSRNYINELPKREATVQKVMKEWINEAKRADKRPSSISSMEDRTRAFVSEYGDTNVHQINYKDVEHIVFKRLQDGTQPSAQTIKNRWSAIRALLNKAINKGYLKKDSNPCEHSNGFSEFSSPTPNKSFLSVEETRNLIEHATEYKDGVMLAYFSLACFSGLRPWEIHGGAFKSPTDCDPLTWDDIDLESKNPEILVSDEHAKTRVTRWAPIQNSNINLKALLLHSKELDHELITIKNFKENWRAVVKLSNLDFSGSEADKPRRSFATYLFNKDRFSADKQLARIMGNTPYVLKKHYKNIIKAGEGKKYFQVGPKGEIMSDEYLRKLS